MSLHAKYLVCNAVLLVLLSGSLTSCKADEHPSVIREQFLRLPMPEQRSTIVNYPPKQQLELYLNAMLEKHPPDLALADAVAKSGAKIIPLLMERISQEDRDVAKMHLIDVFLRMQNLGYYAVASDAQTMSFIKQQVESITDTQWKDISKEMVQQIITGQ